MESWNKRFVESAARAIRPFAIPHLAALLVAGQVVVWLMMVGHVINLDDLVLSFDAVLHGEVWRIFTFLFIPPPVSPIFIIFSWMLFFTFGAALEDEWGREKFNLYILIGVVMTFIAVAIVPARLGTNVFIGESVLLAFAYYNPRYIINLMFILPVPVMWIAWFTWAILGVGFVRGDMGSRLMILASIANFLLFLGDEIWTRTRLQGRAMHYETQRRSARDLPFHMCATCGATERSKPDMQFLYCSKCEGALCYCEDHIHNHEHVKAAATNASA